MLSFKQSKHDPPNGQNAFHVEYLLGVNYSMLDEHFANYHRNEFGLNR